MQSLVFVFPGQGAQAVGMGRDFMEQSFESAALFQAVDEAVGRPISELCFNGPEEALKETSNTQPALFAVSVVALEACRSAGLEPAAVAGHSVGEYAALVAAGAMDVPSGAKLVAARAEAMARAAAQQPGTMAAVLGLDAPAVEAVCAEIRDSGRGAVMLANDNCPGQAVISGETGAVEAAGSLLKERGARRVVPLSVSGAFHSTLMQPAAAAMEQVVRQYREYTLIEDPKLPVVANVTANYARTADQIAENLVQQIAGQVRWTETIQFFIAEGYSTFIECGPGNVLAGLIKRIAPEATIYNVSDTASLEATLASLRGSS